MCGVISKSVTTSAEGVATFAIGLDADIPLENCTLTVDGNNIAMPTKTVEAGHIYNISRKPDLLSGVFSVSDSKKVSFSKGNLQATYNGSSWTWAFAANQWDYIGNAEGNTKVSDSTPFVSGYSGSSTTVDLFGWVGASSNRASFEAAGCVFLPAAGWRDGTTIKNSINDRGYYWSTTPSNATAAKRMFFAGALELDGDNSRAFGFSVRLVREVE